MLGTWKAGRRVFGMTHDSLLAIARRLPARLDPVRPAADPRRRASATSARIGSGNIGATNVLRTGRKDIAARRCCSMPARARWPSLVMAAWAGSDAALLAGVAAVLGHCYLALARLQGRQGRRHRRSACCWPGHGRPGCSACWSGSRRAYRLQALQRRRPGRPGRRAASCSGRSPAAADRAGRRCSSASLCSAATTPTSRRLLAGTEPRIGAKP